MISDHEVWIHQGCGGSVEEEFFEEMQDGYITIRKCDKCGEQWSSDDFSDQSAATPNHIAPTEE
jgi:hypothetical protein